MDLKVRGSIMMTANTKVQAFKRNLIIETAQRLFTQNPYEAVTVEEIAKEAGFGKSTVYSFFESKEELLHTVIIMGLERLSQKFQKISEREPDVRIALKELIPLQYEYFLEFNSLLFTYFQKYSTGAIKLDWYEEMKQMTVNKTAYLVHIMRRGIEEGVFITADPEYLAWFVNSMIKGICMPSLLLKTEIRDKEKDVQMLQKVILNGILSQ